VRDHLVGKGRNGVAAYLRGEKAYLPTDEKFHVDGEAAGIEVIRDAFKAVGFWVWHAHTLAYYPVLGQWPTFKYHFTQDNTVYPYLSRARFPLLTLCQSASSFRRVF